MVLPRIEKHDTDSTPMSIPQSPSDQPPANYSARTLENEIHQLTQSAASIRTLLREIQKSVTTLSSKTDKLSVEWNRLNSRCKDMIASSESTATQLASKIDIYLHFHTTPMATRVDRSLMQDGLGSRHLLSSENGMIQAMGSFAPELNNGVEHDSDTYPNRALEPISVTTLGSIHNDNNVGTQISQVLSPLETAMIELSPKEITESPSRMVLPKPREAGVVSAADISGNIAGSYDDVDVTNAMEVTNNGLLTAAAVEQKVHALENLRNLQISIKNVETAPSALATTRIDVKNIMKNMRTSIFIESSQLEIEDRSVSDARSQPAETASQVPPDQKQRNRFFKSVKKTSVGAVHAIQRKTISKDNFGKTTKQAQPTSSSTSELLTGENTAATEIPTNSPLAVSAPLIAQDRLQDINQKQNGGSKTVNEEKATMRGVYNSKQANRNDMRGDNSLGDRGLEDDSIEETLSEQLSGLDIQLDKFYKHWSALTNTRDQLSRDIDTSIRSLDDPDVLDQRKQIDARVDSVSYLSADEWKSLHGLLQKYAKDSQLLI